MSHITIDFTWETLNAWTTVRPSQDDMVRASHIQYNFPSIHQLPLDAIPADMNEKEASVFIERIAEFQQTVWWKAVTKQISRYIERVTQHTTITHMQYNNQTEAIEYLERLYDNIVHHTALFIQHADWEIVSEEGLITVQTRTPYSHDNEPTIQINPNFVIHFTDIEMRSNYKWNIPEATYLCTQDSEQFFLKKEPADFISEWSALVHPHIGSMGTPCYGIYESRLRRAINEGAFYSAYKIIQQFLNTWSIESPHINIASARAYNTEQGKYSIRPEIHTHLKLFFDVSLTDDITANTAVETFLDVFVDSYAEVNHRIDALYLLNQINRAYFPDKVHYLEQEEKYLRDMKIRGRTIETMALSQLFIQADIENPCDHLTQYEKYMQPLHTHILDKQYSYRTEKLVNVILQALAQGHMTIAELGVRPQLRVFSFRNIHSAVDALYDNVVNHLRTVRNRFNLDRIEREVRTLITKHNHTCMYTGEFDITHDIVHDWITYTTQGIRRNQSYAQQSRTIKRQLQLRRNNE